MEEIQDYLFENKQEFQENHYVNLMDLLVKAYNKPNVSCRVPERINYDITVREIHISEETWNTELKELVENYDYFSSEGLLIFIKLTELAEGEWVKTKFIFPTCLSQQIHRTNMHIICKENYCKSITTGGKLNVIID